MRPPYPTDGRRHRGPSAERHIRCARGQQAHRPSGGLGHAANRRYGALTDRGPLGLSGQSVSDRS